MIQIQWSVFSILQLPKNKKVVIFKPLNTFLFYSYLPSLECTFHPPHLYVSSPPQHPPTPRLESQIPSQHGTGDCGDHGCLWNFIWALQISKGGINLTFLTYSFWISLGDTKWHFQDMIHESMLYSNRVTISISGNSSVPSKVGQLVTLYTRYCDVFCRKEIMIQNS